MPHPYTPISSPLRVLARNPRYFTDDTGRAIYLTGAHTWANFQDNGLAVPPRPFDFDFYLDWLQQHNHNFIRLWVWEQAAFCAWSDEKEIFDPMPYERPGPGLALDGRSKFDLTRLNQVYFDRLRRRVSLAGERGIYVSVMLFQGWSHKKGYPIAPYDPWLGHPLNVANNVNGIDGDRDRDSVADLDDPQVRQVHAAYIRKVVDTVHDLDNVLYEVMNEGGKKSWDWFVVDTVQAHERTKPRQHPVGLTGHGHETTAEMLASPADWISPGENCDPSYKTDPSAWNEQKPSLFDTDHVFGIGGDALLVWKAFLRGHNFVFMDPWDRKDQVRDRLSDTTPGLLDTRFDALRRAMGCARTYADRIDLAAMAPHGEWASTGYCLADPGAEYLVFLPEGGEVSVDLAAASSSLDVEWTHPVSGQITRTAPVSGGGTRTLAAPIAGPAVLYLRRAP